MTSIRKSIPVFGAVALCVLLAACSDEAPKQPKAAAPAAKVAVIEARPERVPVVSDLPGRVAPMVTADVRPRVTGIVLKRVFEQGASVKEGDVLYVIDPEPFQAKVASAKGVLDSAAAAQILAKQRADRQTQLLRGGTASQESADSAIAALAQSNADVERSRADLKIAELDLQYTKIRAPISGTIGRALVTEGAFVSPTSDVMAVIQQIDPIYADFTRPAESLIALKNAVAQGTLKADAAGSAQLKLLSGGGQLYPHDGKLLFTEASVNSATGQVILRGEFPNPDMNLLPGMYVRGRVEQAALDEALAVPEQAVQRDTAGKAQIFVVGNENKVEVRPVDLGWLVDGRWVVMKGLAPGDKVVVEGFQRIAPGARVEPEPWGNVSSSPKQNSDKG
ncbi:efflux RND transporter periplasmic adaptor subunit [Agrobacterium sp. NPDC089420]|uniref:efflux RND transporter periplasmic adaptor subunit n=1 Tax=Agrobacterium sp. NPDC089420 TaxID=3363918 RepID=UPI00384E6E79